MFIEIKHKKPENKEYINIFKIMSVKSYNMLEEQGFPTEMADKEELQRAVIEYSHNGSTCLSLSDESVGSFMKRLRKETKEIESIDTRFDILDL